MANNNAAAPSGCVAVFQHCLHYFQRILPVDHSLAVTLMQRMAEPAGVAFMRIALTRITLALLTSLGALVTALPTDVALARETVRFDSDAMPGTIVIKTNQR